MGVGQYFDLILLAMVAAFVFLRLRGVLGRRTGNERQPGDRLSGGEAPGADDNVIQLPDREDEAAEISAGEEAELWSDDSPVGAGLTQIKIADHNFEPGEFLNGARMAYEMIVGAFADGDQDTLRNLLNEDVYDNFIRAISDREGRGETLETSVVDIKSVDVVEARLNDKTAEITVKIISETISAAKDEDGELIDPEAVHPREVVDIWTFSHNVRSRDPNWLLVETRSQN